VGGDITTFCQREGGGLVLIVMFGSVIVTKFGLVNII